MDSKCRFSTNSDEQMAATSCLKVFGPEASTPTLDPLTSSNIPAREFHLVTKHREFGNEVLRSSSDYAKIL